jgi:hypothetical protein
MEITVTKIQNKVAILGDLWCLITKYWLKLSVCLMKQHVTKIYGETEI